MNRKLAMAQFAIAVSLLGFAFVPGNTLWWFAASVGGLLVAVAWVQWHGPRER